MTNTTEKTVKKSLNQIKVGNVVFSKKDKCKVTVEAITTNDELVCAWYDKENILHREILELEDVEIKNQL